MKIDEWTKFVNGLVGDAGGEAILRSGNAAKIIALAKSKGFAFTERDLADVRISDKDEIGETALDKVSGGLLLPGGIRPTYR